MSQQSVVFPLLDVNLEEVFIVFVPQIRDDRLLNVLGESLLVVLMQISSFVKLIADLKNDTIGKG
jgi:hypothetical protein